jgi:hypothetical protein
MASVNTTVALDFTNVTVNGNITPGNKTFNYEFLPPKSTYIVPPKPAYPMIVNSTTEWVKGQQFNFPAGDITVNDEWVVNFTLRALTEGNILVLSSKSSKVTFTGIVGEVGIPDTYITAMPPGTEMGPTGITCSFTNLRRTNEATETQIAQLAWDPNYNGNQPTINWTVGLAYSPNSPPSWQDPFGKYSHESTVTYSLIIKDLQPGSYTVSVTGRVGDANSDCNGPPYTLIVPAPVVTPQILIR